MALWWPGPWGPMSAVDPKSLAESPHQASNPDWDKPEEKAEPKTARRRKSVAAD